MVSRRGEKITVRFFRWDVKTQSPEEIERLQPFRTTALKPIV